MLYEDAPPNDVPERIDWVSEAWLVSEENVAEGVGRGIEAAVGKEGEGGKGFSEERSEAGNDGM